MDRSVAFFETVLLALSIGVRHDYDGKDGPPGYPDLKGFGAGGRVFFWLRQGMPAPGAVHVDFVAHSEAKVHAAGLAAGVRENHPPGVQPHYARAFSAAPVREPYGDSLEFVFEYWQHTG